jgi:alkylation response protein AidB-like acyl-CoA dehydrogenase
MDFSLSEDQSLFAHTVGQLVARELSRSEPGRDAWAEMAELGWLAVGFGEEAGGYGGAVEAMLVAGGLGRALLPAPFLSTVVLGAGLLARVGTPEQKALLPRIVAGELKLAMPLSEAPDGFDPLRATSRAEPCEAGFVLNGRKNTALGGADADLLLAPVSLGAAGLGVFLLRPVSPGLRVLRGHLPDGRDVADLVLDDVNVREDSLLGGGPVPVAVLEHVVDMATTATCADAVGAMGEALRLTIDYLKTRRQFGTPLASFQALQHRIVDMRMELDHATSLTEVAAMACDGRDPVRRARLVSAAKARVAKAARFIGEQSIQLHGGIGMTAEHAIGRYFKRLLSDEMLFGDRSFHLDRLAEASAS